MQLDGAMAQEEVGGDLPVRLARGGRRGDLSLALAERGRRRTRFGGGARCAQPGERTLGPRRSSQPLECPERSGERRAGFAAPALAAERLTEVQVGARDLEHEADRVEGRAAL